MDGVKVGHFTDAVNGTGVSVFLFAPAASGAYVLAGSAPASHELATLDLETTVSQLHGLVFTGGSAYGLFAAKGVMQFLAERHIGYKVPHGVVPIVPAAAIYDLIYKAAQAPTDEEAYQACLAAHENNQSRGRIGAGTGATVGKLIPDAKRMTAGLGYATSILRNGCRVEAYAVVNAVGDVRAANGDIIAGACYGKNEFANCEQYLLAGKADVNLLQAGHTTLAAIFTNARFSTLELKRIAKMAIAGMARALSPVFTCYDGDIVFAISSGEMQAAPMTIGVLAAETLRLAIWDAVKESEVIV